MLGLYKSRHVELVWRWGLPQGISFLVYADMQ